MPRSRLRRAGGSALFVSFLSATLALSAWLGYQAADAAASHRRTAEGVLGDYAGIAASAFRQSIEEHLDDFLDEVFDDVPRRSRFDRLPGPAVVSREMPYAIRETHCRCAALRARAVYFRLDGRDGTATIRPDTLAPWFEGLVEEHVAKHYAARPTERGGVFTISDEGPLGPNATVAYRVTRAEDDHAWALYGFVADRESFAQLIDTWHHHRLLPRVVADGVPDDSLLAVALSTEAGAPLFASTPDYPADFLAVDTLDSRLGGYIVEARIRPDAAARLVIGGLPRSRLPLLATLFVLTLGLGAASLVQMRREQQLARLRDDFVSGVSHEFRTPLTQIRLFAELLHDGKLGSETSRRRASAVIHREALRLTHLIENVLSFSSAHRSGRSRIDDTLVRDVVRDVVEGFAPIAERRGVRIGTDIDASLRMRASRATVHRILTNLVDNALKYGPDGQRIDIAATSANGRVRITVSDAGPGVPKSEREKIWHPYERLDRDVSGPVQGSGIGLAVVAELARRHGGRVGIQDVPAGGSRFFVEMRIDPLVNDVETGMREDAI